MSQLIFQTQSTIIVLLMTYGVLQRKNRKLHVRTMSTVIIWDILLVLQIELSRNAILKASKAISNPAILNIHILLAISTVLMYFGMLYTGRKVLKNDQNIRSIHKKMGITTYILRILTYITSYFAVN